MALTFATPSGAFATVDVFDTATNLFTPSGRLETARFLHTATRLNNGQVLITGGQLRTNPTPCTSIPLNCTSSAGQGSCVTACSPPLASIL